MAREDKDAVECRTGYHCRRAQRVDPLTAALFDLVSLVHHLVTLSYIRRSEFSEPDEVPIQTGLHRW
jgi:hypothetical protein